MIELSNVSLRAGEFELCDISFTVPTGIYAALMGRTGCGKTSLLEAICGLRRIAAGTIRVDTVDVTDWSPGHRGIGYVPQDLALFPTFTVAEHLQFAMRIRKWKNADIADRTAELAAVLGIEHLLQRRIQGLSGGESQRTALGRALSFRPSVLLLDEPFSALDETTRNEMFNLLHIVTQTNEVTTLHITHNREEAQSLASLHLMLEDGKMTESQLRPSFTGDQT